MLQKDDKEELEIIKIVDLNPFKLKEEIFSENILNSIDKKQNKIRFDTEILNEDQKHDKKKKIKNYQSFDGAGKRRKNKDTKISKNVKKIMSDVGKLVLDMNSISENSYKTNINSLVKTTNEIKKTEILPEKNIILKIKEKEYKDALEGKIKKPPNFRVLSDCYRNQINKAFVNYNPNIHISNIHRLRKVMPETEKEYQNRLAEINELIDIRNYQQGKGYIKNNQLNKLKKNNSSQDNNNSSGINGSIGYTVATAESENNSQVIPQQTINIYGKKKPKVEIKRKFPEKEKREKELNLMKNVLTNIDNSISKENIGNYFDQFKELQGTDIPQQKHIFFNGLGKANKLLTEIQEVLHYKDTDEFANTKKKLTTVESDNLVDKLGYLKKAAINEIDAFEKKENKIYSQK